MTPNRVICGDACSVMREMPPAVAQAIVADPPYFQVLDETWDLQWPDLESYLRWCEEWVGEGLRILRDDGLFFIFGQLGKREHGFIHLMSRLCARFQFHDLIIWDRVVGYNERRDSFTPAYEMILVLRKSESAAVKFNKDAVRHPYSEKTISMYLRDKRYKDREARARHLRRGKYATNILAVPSLKGSSKEKCGHPSQKPEKLINKLISCATDPGDLVVDPFLGSGSTAMAAKALGRQWIGVEIDSAYCEMANARLGLARDPAKSETSTSPSAKETNAPWFGTTTAR